MGIEPTVPACFDDPGVAGSVDRLDSHQTVHELDKTCRAHSEIL
jgi:hypothetical protein